MNKKIDHIQLALPVGLVVLIVIVSIYMVINIFDKYINVYKKQDHIYTIENTLDRSKINYLLVKPNHTCFIYPTIKDYNPTNVVYQSLNNNNPIANQICVNHKLVMVPEIQYITP